MYFMTFPLMWLELKLTQSTSVFSSNPETVDLCIVWSNTQFRRTHILLIYMIVLLVSNSSNFEGYSAAVIYVSRLFSIVHA